MDTAVVVDVVAVADPGELVPAGRLAQATSATSKCPSPPQLPSSGSTQRAYTGGEQKQRPQRGHVGSADPTSLQPRPRRGPTAGTARRPGAKAAGPNPQRHQDHEQDEQRAGDVVEGVEEREHEMPEAR